MKWVERETGPGIAEQAAAWLIELEEPDARTHAGFAAWLEESPRHIEEFLLATAVWKELDGVDAQRRIEIQQLVEQAKRNVTRLGSDRVGDESAPAETKWRHRRVLSAVAAALLLTFGAFFAFLLTGTGSTQTFVTARGEQRTFKLEDGSLVQLNTQSRVEVRYSNEWRDIHLLEGEALFTVEHDGARPFRVQANGTVIQAIGTRFNVYRSAAGTTVSVVEGIVQISASESRGGESTAPPRVSAGEQARVSPRGEIVKQAVPDLAQVVAWRERRLVFNGDTLETVAAEFNRYNTLQIRVEGEAVRHKRLTGVFDADDPHSLVQFLRGDANLAVSAGVREVLIRPN